MNGALSIDVLGGLPFETMRVAAACDLFSLCGPLVLEGTGEHLDFAALDDAATLSGRYQVLDVKNVHEMQQVRSDCMHWLACHKVSRLV